jgi:hypothetical protein
MSSLLLLPNKIYNVNNLKPKKFLTIYHKTLSLLCFYIREGNLGQVCTAKICTIKTLKKFQEISTSSYFAGRLFYGSNGITISADRRTVYVNDPTDLRISVMHRDPASGHLRQGFWTHSPPPHPPPPKKQYHTFATGNGPNRVATVLKPEF